MRQAALFLTLVMFSLFGVPKSAVAQVPATAGGLSEFGCVVERNSPCQGRVDFQKGRSYEFKIVGPGKALVDNQSNRRCTLEYSLTGSTVASAGRTMVLGPSGQFALDVPDTLGVVLRFIDRGAGSTSCDLLVSVT